MASDPGPVQRRGLTVRVTYQGEKLEFAASAKDEVSALSAQIACRTGVKQSRQRLICGGRVLSDASAQLSKYLPRAGATEVAMILMQTETGDRGRGRLWQSIWAWLELVWAVVYRFFHSLLMPAAYAGALPKSGDPQNAGGPQPGDLAGLAAACGAGG